jgi:hypothetical protein
MSASVLSSAWAKAPGFLAATLFVASFMAFTNLAVLSTVPMTFLPTSLTV